MMVDLFKYLLIVLLALPFAALISDALGRTEGLVIKAASAAAAASWFLALIAAGGQRPNVAKLFDLAFLVWPLLLMAAKGFRPAMSWRSICYSVPVMSWYLANVSILIYLPVDRPGLGAGLALIAGWFYMIPFFAGTCGFFLAVRAIIRRFKEGPGSRDKPKVRITLNV